MSRCKHKTGIVWTMDEHVVAMCEQLIKAVNVTMNAESSQIYRLEALKVASFFGC